MSDQQSCAAPAMAAAEEIPAPCAVSDVPPAESDISSTCNRDAPVRDFGWPMEAFHRVTGLILFLITLPLYPLIWLLIKTDDGGSLFYRGERLGKDQRPFTITKFRTLRENSEEELNGRLLPIASGFETRIGRFLRESRIDEIPQFWNVVRGEMHLVGPRPVRESVYNSLCSTIKGFDRLFLIKPGMTGFAQFYTPYHTDKRIRLRLNNIYLARKSVRLDATLLFATLFVAVRGVGRQFLRLMGGGPMAEWKRAGGVDSNRRQLSRTLVCGDVWLSYSLGENGRSRTVKRRGQLIDINERAIALLTRRALPAEAGELQLVLRVSLRRGRGRKYKVARCRGRVIRRVVHGAAGPNAVNRHCLSVVRFTPASDLDFYKIEKYFLCRSVADR
jgi:lipopolysaccharide/colanic/teichoic acid biosynthesis glycosyltransferase